MTFGDRVTIFKTQTEASNFWKTSAKIYRAETIAGKLKSWPELETLDVRRTSANDCNKFASKFSSQCRMARGQLREEGQRVSPWHRSYVSSRRHGSEHFDN
jgi:hypothetical protein